MSIHDSREIGNVKIVMLKGEKGEKGDGVYDDTEVRQLLNDEKVDRKRADATLEQVDALLNQRISQLVAESSDVSSYKVKTIEDEIYFDFRGGGKYEMDGQINLDDLISELKIEYGKYDVEVIEFTFRYEYETDEYFSGTIGDYQLVGDYDASNQTLNHLYVDFDAQMQKNNYPTGSLVLAYNKYTVDLTVVYKTPYHNRELEDIRVGADGTTYTSAGDSVRAKVNVPLDSLGNLDFGQKGQALITNGDGSTEWIDRALPTDEQTEEAISAWLDEHPEATTTVQDNSLTTAKYQDGSVTEEKLSPQLNNKIELIEPINQSYLLLDNPNAFLKLSEPWFVRNGMTYAQQGVCVTDQYIVLGGNSIGSDLNVSNYLYVLDKDTYLPVELESGNPIYYDFDASTIPTKSHVTNMFYVQETNEIYVTAASDSVSIVYDAETFDRKRTESRPQLPSWLAYDNINKLWVMMWYDTASMSFWIYDQTQTNLLKTFTIDAEVNIMQGLFFHDGLIYVLMTLSDDQSDGLSIYERKQGIYVLDMNGRSIKSWWFNSIYEIEGMDVIDDGTFVISASDNGYIKVYEMMYESSAKLDKKPFKHFSLCGSYEKIPTIGMEDVFASASDDFVSLTDGNQYIVNDGYIRKIGKMAYLYLISLKDLPANTRTTIATLPNGFIPISSINADFAIPNTSGDVIRVYIQANGNLDVYNYSSNTGTLNVRVVVPYYVG